MAVSKLFRARWLFAAAVVIVAALLAWRFFFAGPPAPAFITAPVTRGDIQDTVLASGTFQAINQVSVGAQVSGQLKSLKVALGDTVKKGQLVAEIDSLTQQNTLRSDQAALAVSQAELTAAQATLVQARLAYRRQQELRSADASARADYEEAEATYKSAQATVDQRRAEVVQAQLAVDTAQVNLGYTKITSPIDGVVVAVVATEGQTLNANQSTPTIIKVADLSTMTVAAEISEADVTRVKPGQRLYFTILGEPDRRYDGVLRAIEPASTSTTSSSDSTTSTSSSSSSSSTSSSSSSAIYYNGLFDVPNAEGMFRIDMTAEVNIVRGEATNALVIPATALQDGGRSGQYLVRIVGPDGQAQARHVRIGINNKVSAQVLDGLSEGDRVIVGDGGQPGGSSSSGSRRRGPPGPMGL